ncbi:hypothetical protein BHE74_00022839, partial [Ensete ventricosum]
DFSGRRACLIKALKTGPSSPLSSIRSDFLEASAGLEFVFLVPDPLLFCSCWWCCRFPEVRPALRSW